MMEPSFPRQTCRCFSHSPYLYLLVLLLGNWSLLFAQKGNSDAAPFWSDELGKIAYTPESAGWYKFKPNTVKDAAQFFIRYKAAFGLNTDDSMKLTHTAEDAAGRVHYRFQQYYKGIRIEGAEYLLHEKDGYATSANGKMVYNLKAGVNPVISESAALSKTLLRVPASLYKLHPSDKQILTSNAYHPGAELVYQKQHANLPFTPENFRLCYHFNIYKHTGEGYSVYIDANTGELVNKLPLQSECISTGTSTNFYGPKTIFTSGNATGYYLQDDCTPSTISIYNNNNNITYSGDMYTSSVNTGWGGNNDLQSAATSLWTCRRTVDFYKNVLSRNGYDNDGGNVSVYQNAGFSSGTSVYYANASMTFSGGMMKIGNNGTLTNTDDWNTLDIVAHELTHAVTGATSKLDYQGESGALNESFSDIMGAYVEYWDGGSPFDWLIGEDRGSAFRSLQNPGQYGHPSTYKSPVNWYTGTGDNGGVHINSGVQNFWFYLLCQGGSGTNDNGKSYMVKGIGIADAGFIAYMTDAYYLTSGAQYIDARNQSIQVAIDYYGSCSVAALETAKAWYAVGVGGSQSLAYDRNLCGDYTANEAVYHFRGVDVLPVSNGCTVTLNPAAHTYVFTAAKSVVLLPGFTALAGSSVNIYIDPCDITVNAYTAAATAPQEAALGNPVAAPTAAGDLDAAAFKAYPNPAYDRVYLVCSLPQRAGRALVEVYDTYARQVKVVYLGPLFPGKQTIPINVAGLASGTYTAVLRAAPLSFRTRIVVVK